MSLMESAGKGAWLGSVIGCAIAAADLIANAGTGSFLFTSIANQWTALLPNLFVGSLTGALITGSVFTIGYAVGSVLGLTGDTPPPAPLPPPRQQPAKGQARQPSQGMDQKAINAQRQKEYYRNAEERTNTWEDRYFEQQEAREKNDVSR